MFFGSTMIMVTVALVMAVITTNLYAKKDSAVECPRWVVRMALKFFPEVVIPPEKPQRGSRRSKHDCNGRQSDVLSVTDGELDSLTCGCCCHNGNSPMQTSATLDMERIEVEWKLVSKFMDRVFFWLFVALSLTVQVALFMHMVPKDPVTPKEGD